MERVNPMMRIKAAAILHEDVIYEGRAHAEIGWEMIDIGACQRPFPSGFFQGFVTDGGNYVDRKLAFRIALTAGQFEEKDACNPDIGLFSEDLIHSKIWDYPLKSKRYIRT
jgi:hypothetical protein